MDWSILDIEKFFKFWTIILSGILIVITFSKNIRDIIIQKIKDIKKKRRARKEIPELLNSLHSKVDTMGKRVEFVESQVSPNSGGSIKDTVSIIQAEIEATNWLSSVPSFRCTTNGANTFVNEAYCEICGCSADELLLLSWRNFAYDKGEVEKYYERWMESSNTLSQFVSKMKYKDKKGEYRGEWMVRIRPLGPITLNGKSDYLWHGTLYPVDDVASTHQNRFDSH